VPLKGFIGDYIDLETIYIFKKFFSLNGSSFFINSIKGNFDSSLNYSFNAPLEIISSTDLCLIIDINVRLELPLINSKIRQLAFKNTLPVFITGFYSNFNYFVKHLSTSSKFLLNVIEGNHWVSAKLSKNSSFKPLLLVGEDSVFSQLTLVSYLSKNTNIFKKD
jgi:NADH dehydrogenase/NADH:ubiquinone oxidoreductase subunit G